MSVVGCLTCVGIVAAGAGIAGAAGKGEVIAGGSGSAGVVGVGGDAGATVTASVVAARGREPDNVPGPAQAASRDAASSMPRATRAGTIFLELSVMGRRSSP